MVVFRIFLLFTFFIFPNSLFAETLYGSFIETYVGCGSHNEKKEYSLQMSLENSVGLDLSLIATPDIPKSGIQVQITGYYLESAQFKAETITPLNNQDINNTTANAISSLNRLSTPSQTTRPVTMFLAEDSHCSETQAKKILSTLADRTAAISGGSLILDIDQDRNGEPDVFKMEGTFREYGCSSDIAHRLAFQALKKLEERGEYSRPADTRNWTMISSLRRGGNACGTDGAASINGNKIVLHLCDAAVLQHELGHNLGLGHAGADTNNDQAIDEYGDIASIMGFVTHSPDKTHNAYHQFLLNMIPADKIMMKEIVEDETFEIAKLDLDNHPLKQLLIIDQEFGIDHSEPFISYMRNYLTIHTKRRDGHNKSVSLAELRPGEEFELSREQKVIFVEELGPETAKFSIRSVSPEGRPNRLDNVRERTTFGDLQTIVTPQIISSEEFPVESPEIIETNQDHSPSEIQSSPIEDSEMERTGDDRSELLNECIDTDGDGWGWDGNASCKVEGYIPVAGECIDSDGDGWGWDGVESCRMSDQAGTDTSAPRNVDLGTDKDSDSESGWVDCKIYGARNGELTWSPDTASQWTVEGGPNGLEEPKGPSQYFEFPEGDTMKEKTFKVTELDGQLRAISVTCGTEIVNNGDSASTNSGDQENEDESPLALTETSIEEDPEEEHVCEVETDDSTAEIGSRTEDPLGNSHYQELRTAVIVINKESSSTSSTEAFEGIFFGEGSSIANLVKIGTRFHRGLAPLGEANGSKVYSIAVNPEELNDICEKDFAVVDSIADRIDFNKVDYDLISYIVQGNISCGRWSGKAGGKTSLVLSPSTRLILHEIGHNLGFGHTKGPLRKGLQIPSSLIWFDDGNSYYEYGDYLSVMGAGAGLFNPNDLLRHGWDEAELVSESGTYKIAGLYMSSPDMVKQQDYFNSSENNFILEVDGRPSSLLLSLDPISTESILGSNQASDENYSLAVRAVNSQLSVTGYLPNHRIIKNRGESVLLDGISSGEEFVDPASGIKVEYLGASSQNGSTLAEVRITVPPQKFEGFEILEAEEELRRLSNEFARWQRVMERVLLHPRFSTLDNDQIDYQTVVPERIERAKNTVVLLDRLIEVMERGSLSPDDTDQIRAALRTGERTLDLFVNTYSRLQDREGITVD